MNPERTASLQSPKNILVAVDGSEISGKAIAFAIMVAKLSSSSLTILNVIQLPGFLSMQEPTMSRTVDRVLDDYKRKARETITPFMDNALSKAKAEGVHASSEILDMGDSPVKGITDYAEAHKIDLIIVGNRGLGGFKKLLIGSVSSGIVNHAHCSVIVVK